MTIFIYCSILLRWKLKNIKINILSISNYSYLTLIYLNINNYFNCLLINIKEYYLLVKNYILINLTIFLIIHLSRIKFLLFIIYFFIYIIIAYLNLTYNYIEISHLYFFIVNDLNSLSFEEDIFWSNNLNYFSIWQSQYNNNLELDLTNIQNINVTRHKSILSKDYLNGQERWDNSNNFNNFNNFNNPTPENSNNENILGIITLNDSNNSNNNFNDNSNNNHSITIENPNSNFNSNNNQNYRNIINSEFNPYSKYKEDWVYGWSLFGTPDNTVYMPIYFDYNYKQGFFTDNGDFFIPGQAYGFFDNHLIKRDLDDNIISEHRIKFNTRPEIFTGKVYGPPFSHKITPPSEYLELELEKDATEQD
jgi:hypothetical protein